MPAERLLAHCAQGFIAFDPPGLGGADEAVSPKPDRVKRRDLNGNVRRAVSNDALGDDGVNDDENDCDNDNDDDNDNDNDNSDAGSEDNNSGGVCVSKKSCIFYNKSFNYAKI